VHDKPRRANPSDEAAMTTHADQSSVAAACGQTLGKKGCRYRLSFSVPLADASVTPTVSYECAAERDSTCAAQGEANSELSVLPSTMPHASSAPAERTIHEGHKGRR
jgi:hypothetical protein